MRIYVAGPMRCYKDFNFPKFAEATEYLRSQGHEVISPAEEDLKEGFDPTVEIPFAEGQYEQWMARDMALIAQCDAIYLLPGWEASEGAKRECAQAEKLGLKILQEYTYKTEEQS